MSVWICNSPHSFHISSHFSSSSFVVRYLLLLLLMLSFLRLSLFSHVTNERHRLNAIKFYILYVLRKKKKKLFFIFDKLRRSFPPSFPFFLCISFYFLCFMQSRKCLLEIHEKVSCILTMCYSCFHRYCFCVFLLLALLLIWPHHSYLFFTYTNVHMRDFYYCNIFFRVNVLMYLICRVFYLVNCHTCLSS